MENKSEPTLADIWQSFAKLGMTECLHLNNLLCCKLLERAKLIAKEKRGDRPMEFHGGPHEDPRETQSRQEIAVYDSYTQLIEHNFDPNCSYELYSFPETGLKIGMASGTDILTASFEIRIAWVELMALDWTSQERKIITIAKWLRLIERNCQIGMSYHKAGIESDTTKWPK